MNYALNTPLKTYPNTRLAFFYYLRKHFYPDMKTEKYIDNEREIL